MCTIVDLHGQSLGRHGLDCRVLARLGRDRELVLHAGADLGVDLVERRRAVELRDVSTLHLSCPSCDRHRQRPRQQADRHAAAYLEHFARSAVCNMSLVAISFDAQYSMTGLEVSVKVSATVSGRFAQTPTD